MYKTIYMDERVALPATELNHVKHTSEIKDFLEKNLRELLEGKCNSNGYVRPGSIKLLGRSMGVAENGKFTGNLVFDCKVSCEVLYPTAGSVITANVIKVNKMGVYAVFEDAMRILLPRDLHVGDTEFDGLKERNTVKVRIERSRFQTNDTFIMAVGKLHSGAE
jgi:DNA-directed RNA polymerase subunit E'/Rpb7